MIIISILFLFICFSLNVLVSAQTDVYDIIISEIMYANEPPNVAFEFMNAYEFIEFKNLEDRDIDLSGWTVGGLGYTFPPGATIKAKGFHVLARVPSKFEEFYKVKADNTQQITAKLSNRGERITLRNGTRPVGLTPEEEMRNDVISISYDTALPWPEMADNRGFSLVPINPNEYFDHDDPYNWRASSKRNGSPGRDDLPSTVPQLLINEILTNPNAENNEVDFVELYNPNNFEVKLDHWCLTDILSNITQFQFPVGTGSIPANGYRTVPVTEFKFGLSAKGDDKIFIVSHDGNEPTGWAHGFSFSAAPRGIPFGRFVNGVNRELFVLLKEPTPGKANADPIPPIVYIAEIDYNPLTGVGMECTSDLQCEFIRIQNSLKAEVNLFDQDLDGTPWRIGGLNFTLPRGVILPADGVAYITPADPAKFKQIKRLPDETLVFGPAEGTLSNNGETLTIYRPLPKDATDLIYPYAIVDRVTYSDDAPWPEVADGSGKTLHRCDPTLIGDDASNWGTMPECVRKTVMPTPAVRPTSPPISTTPPAMEASVDGLSLSVILAIFGGVLLCLILVVVGVVIIIKKRAE